VGEGGAFGAAAVREKEARTPQATAIVFIAAWRQVYQSREKESTEKNLLIF